MPPESPLQHHARHPRSFLDIEGAPDGLTLTARFWCIECHEEIEMSEAAAEEWADRGIPWRTGTE